MFSMGWKEGKEKSNSVRKNRTIRRLRTSIEIFSYVIQTSISTFSLKKAVSFFFRGVICKQPSSLPWIFHTRKWNGHRQLKSWLNNNSKHNDGSYRRKKWFSSERVGGKKKRFREMNWHGIKRKISPTLEREDRIVSDLKFRYPANKPQTHANENIWVEKHVFDEGNQRN